MHESVQGLDKRMEVVGRKQEGRDFGATFLKCNQPSDAFAPNVNRGQGDSISSQLPKVM